jgi:16S rRNA (cytidine1402-2'-O)-methyltransferase
VTDDSSNCFSREYLDVLFSLNHFVVENVRTARRFLSRMKHPRPISELYFFELNNHTTSEDWNDLQAFLEEDHHTGLMSEAGCPGVADPGADLVAYAHSVSMRVEPLTGPSSILLALMASGLNGQNFSFNGYTPKNEPERGQLIREYERESVKTARTQIFIETPYRNIAFFQSLTKNLKPGTRLTLACELTHKTGWVKTRSIADWKHTKPPIHKKNTVFLFLA